MARLLSPPPSKPNLCAYPFSPLPQAVYRPARSTLPAQATKNVFMFYFRNKIGSECFWGRKWNSLDMGSAAVVVSMHLLCLFAPFTFNWAALGIAFGLYVITGLLGITLSFHRNLSHRSFKLPQMARVIFVPIVVSKHFSHMSWMFDTNTITERPNNVGDLEKQRFYQFVRDTYAIHPVSLAALLYAMGVISYIVWGMEFSMPCMGKQSWNTGDLSRNNWWWHCLHFGEGWHNNHHVFEYSASAFT
ncbi:hypothetical protein HAX54_027530 [Datura stramonium]|uniref:Fatty acid desaturase domain-containing protein n=1 Tax=Datura stramonium TaxID=4076 RepID=A0ABS8V591_DATST|nr:hypothetical protein [Datura stramonium]